LVSFEIFNLATVGINKDAKFESCSRRARLYVLGRNKFSEVGCESYGAGNPGYKSRQKLSVWGPSCTVGNFEKLPRSGLFT